MLVFEGNQPKDMLQRTRSNGQANKGKRHSTEDKIRILRQADADESIVEILFQFVVESVMPCSNHFRLGWINVGWYPLVGNECSGGIEFSSLAFVQDCLNINSTTLCIHKGSALGAEVKL